MKNEAFIKEVKVGFGGVIFHFFKTLFKLTVRGLTILENKIVGLLKKKLPEAAVE